MLKHISKVVGASIGRGGSENSNLSQLSYLCVAGSVEGGTTTFLAFTSAGRSPEFVVKIFRDTADTLARMNNECNILTMLSNNKKVGDSVPKVICSGVYENHAFLVQSVVNGISMPLKLEQSGFPVFSVMKSHLHAVLEWLVHLCGIQPGLNDVGKHNLLDEFERFTLFDESQFRNNRFLAEIEARIPKPKLCLQHTDLSRQNILCTGNTKILKVIDWTDAKLDGMPFYDLFYFMANYVAIARKKTGLQSLLSVFDYFFFTKNSYSGLIRSTVESYCEKTGICVDDAVFWFGLFLIRHTLFEAEKLKKSLKNGYMPKFNLSLAAENATSWMNASREQLWYHLFLFTGKNYERFLPK